MPPRAAFPLKTYRNLSKILGECVIASLGLFLAGYQMSALDDVKLALAGTLDWSAKEMQSHVYLCSVLFIVGGFAGAFTTGFMSPYMGRKKTMILADFIAFLGIGICLVVNDIRSFAIGRFIVGVSAGINTVVVPLFIFETLPLEIFHIYGSINQISFMIGYVVSHTFATMAFLGFNREIYIQNRGALWKALFAVPLGSSLIRCMVYIFCWEKDTAKFYVFKHLDREAIDNLKATYKPEWIVAKTRELISIRNDQSEPHTKATYCNMFNQKYISRTLICVVLGVINQLSGINSFLFYKNQAIIDTELVGEHSNIVLMSWAAVSVVSALLTPIILANRGKKKVMLMGNAVMIVSLAIIVLASIEKIPLAAELMVGSHIGAYSLSYGALTWIFYCYLLPDQGICIVKAIEWAVCGFYVHLINRISEGDFFLTGSDLLVQLVIFIAFGFFFTLEFVKEIKGKDYFTIKRKFELGDEDERVKEVFLKNKPSIFD